MKLPLPEIRHDRKGFEALVSLQERVVSPGVV